MPTTIAVAPDERSNEREDATIPAAQCSDGAARRGRIRCRDVKDAVGGVAVAVDVDVRLGDGLGRFRDLSWPVLTEIDSEVLARGLHVRVPPPRRYRTSPPRHGCYSRLVRVPA